MKENQILEIWENRTIKIINRTNKTKQKITCCGALAILARARRAGKRVTSFSIRSTKIGRHLRTLSVSNEEYLDITTAIDIKAASLTS